jgi:hypothetical protein
VIRGRVSEYHLEIRDFEHPQVVSGLNVTLRNRGGLVNPGGVLFGEQCRGCTVRGLTSTERIARGKPVKHPRALTHQWKRVH